MSSEESRRLSKTVRTVRKAPQPVNVNGSQVLVSVGRAVAARCLFILHSMITISQTVSIADNDAVWGFALLSLLIVFEGLMSVVMRAGDERKWFCTSVLLYVLATAPPIWILESKMCEMRAAGGHAFQGAEGELKLQILEQLLLVTLIIGRWILPKGDISREQLSQILLAYLAISSDIVEFFDVFKEKPVYTDSGLQKLVLTAWTLSLLQFPFVLTVSRARKMRIAVTKTYEELIIPRRRHFWQIVYDVDIWAIFLANGLQDIPFLLVRIHLMVNYGLAGYTMIFFTCKNALIIVLQTYRGIILLNDRYLHPQPDLGLLDVPLMDHRDHHHHKPSPGRHRKKRNKENRDSEKEHLYPKRHHKRRRRTMDVLEEIP